MRVVLCMPIPQCGVYYSTDIFGTHIALGHSHPLYLLVPRLELLRTYFTPIGTPPTADPVEILHSQLGFRPKRHPFTPLNDHRPSDQAHHLMRIVYPDLMGLDAYQASGEVG